MAEYNFTRKPALLKIERILALLAQLDHSAPQLARKLFTTERTMLKYMAHLHGQGLVHVCGWHHPPRGSKVPIYRAGPGRDAPQPQPKERGQYEADYRKRRDADMDKRDRYLARRRRWWHETNGREKNRERKPDQAAAWLFNPIPVETHQTKEGTAP